MRAAIYLKNRVPKEAALAGKVLPLLMNPQVLNRPKKVASHIAGLIGAILRKSTDGTTIPQTVT